MPEREVKKPKKTNEENTVEKKMTQNPMMYAFTVILLILIAVTFIGGPLLQSADGGSAATLGKYGDKPIQWAEGSYFQRQVNNINQYYSNLGSSYDSESLLRLVWQSAFRVTAMHHAKIYDSENSGLVISKDLVDKKLTEYPGYMDKGEFSPEKYKEVSDSQKYTIRKFMEDDLLRAQYDNDVFNSFVTNKKEVEFLSNMGKAERKFDFVVFSLSDYPQEEIAAFGAENEQLFHKLNLSRIYFTGPKADLEAVREGIVTGVKQFAEYAKEMSEDSYKDIGGDMGVMYYYEHEPFFENAADLEALASLKRGETSAIVKMPAQEGEAWALYYANEDAAAPNFDDPETSVKVKEYMIQLEKGTLQDYAIAKAEEFITSANESSFDDAADTMGLIKVSTDYFPINMGGVEFIKRINTASSHQVITAGAAKEEFFETLFKLKDGDVSNYMILGDYIAVFQMTGEKENEEVDSEDINTYIDYVLTQYRQVDFEEVVMSSELLEDNFEKVFQDMFAQQ